jgi:hypothetical protein
MTEFGTCKEEDIEEAKKQGLFCNYENGNLLSIEEGQKIPSSSVVDLENHIIGPRDAIMKYRNKKARSNKYNPSSIQTYISSFSTMSDEDIKKNLEDLGIEDYPSDRREMCLCICKYYYDRLVGGQTNYEKTCPCPSTEITAYRKTVVFNLEEKPKESKETLYLETKKGKIYGKEYKLKCLQEILDGEIKGNSSYSASPKMEPPNESEIELPKSSSSLKREDVGFSSSLAPIRENITKTFEDCLKSISIA